MQRANRKRSFTIKGHRTSVALEPEFWTEVERWAAQRGISLSQLVAEVDAGRPDIQPLSSAIRVAILKWIARS
jgi:predicted DNA-binding ribbon-helix-helix protein